MDNVTALGAKDQFLTMKGIGSFVRPTYIEANYKKDNGFKVQLLIELFI